MFTITPGSNAKREPLPRGFVNAICADFYTKEEDDKFNPGQRKTVVVLTFVTSIVTKDKDGNPRNAMINLFSNATWGGGDKPSNLRKFIESWFGPLTDEQLASFDFDKLIGRKCSILVEHKRKQDGTIADRVALASDVRADLDKIDSIPTSFVRKADRTTAGAQAGSIDDGDNDLPF